MRRIYRRCLGLVMAAALVIGLTGTLAACGGSSGSGGGVKVMYTMNPLDDFRSLLLDGVQKAASAEGVTLDVMPECQTVDEQIAQVKSAAESGYDAIICLPVDTETALQLEVAS
ncbi:MAG: hypothetical protein IJV04_09050 [Lachnospiraceae bacterium]|nr:hypothetical protein [Lachnospiraceae bacterium]